MKTLRIVLGILATVPLSMIVDSLFHPANYGPGTLGELLYLIFGVPILIINMWAWVYPEIIEFYLFSNGRKENKP